MEHRNNPMLDNAENQSLFNEWIQEWKQHRHGDMADCFHDVSAKGQSTIDPLDNGSYLYRIERYSLSISFWASILKEMEEQNLIQLRFHLSIAPRLANRANPMFIPLAQPIHLEKLFETNGEEGKGNMYPCRPYMPNVVSSRAIISRELESNLRQSWAILPTHLISEQFESSWVENANPTVETFSAIKKQRVNHFTFQADDVNNMPDSTDGITNIYFYPGINHNFDQEGRPSFAPILSFEQSSDTSTRNIGTEGIISFEYSSPCPPFCHTPPS